MAHFLAFCLHVPPTLGQGRGDDGNLIDDLEIVSVVDKRVGLLGVVRQEPNLDRPRSLRICKPIP